MNTDNLDLSEIKWMLFKPVPNQPGYVQFDRNLTIKQFAEAIKARLPNDIRSRLECFAPYQYNDNRKDDAQISGNGKDEYAGNTDLVSHWEQGTNEGFYTSVYAVATYMQPGRRLIWSAKMFDPLVAIALDLCLHCWISGPQNGQEHAARKILQSINFD